MREVQEFRPEAPLIPDRAHPSCRAIVILPARNEEGSLASALDALAGQVDEFGRLLSPETFEILLLLNNCTDGSAHVARRWKTANPSIHLHVIELDLAMDCAHLGVVRRLLMDTAWHRLPSSCAGIWAILSTDSDTLVAADWIMQNLRALERGADAVGGAIRLKHGELELLPAGARRAYQRDRRYQRLVAELEDLLDPQPGDRWPRHLEHFGASLACTTQAYVRAGGMPPVRSLEDVAFVDALRRVNARLRHDPGVVVYTSSRFDGRAEIGLSYQLRVWQQMSVAGEEHHVLSAAWLVHRFRTLRYLRQIHAQGEPADSSVHSKSWRDRIMRARTRDNSVAAFLREMDCDRLIEETFEGERESEILRVNRHLARTISRMRSARASAAVTA